MIGSLESMPILGLDDFSKSGEAEGQSIDITLHVSCMK